MAAYAISEVEVLYEAQAQRYRELAEGFYRAVRRPLPCARRATAGAGREWSLDERVVIVEFPNLGRLREWYASPEYAEALHVRQTALARRLLFVEGEDLA